MQHHQDWSIQVLSNPVLTQIAPLITVAVVFFFSFIHLRQLNLDRLIYILNQILVMVLDSLGISLPWLWGGPQKTLLSSRSKSHRRKSSTSKVVKSRSEQIALQKPSNESAHGLHSLFLKLLKGFNSFFS